jgi:lysophospholipase
VTFSPDTDLASPDGTRLARYRLTPPHRPPRGTVVLVHGLGEHAGRYAHLAAHLGRRGWAVLAGDLRGHGRSGGQRGHARRFGDYLDDLALLLGDARRSTPGPVVLFGHSLGAVIATRYVQTRNPGDLGGLVLSGIGLDLGLALPPWKRWASRVAASVFPRLAAHNGIAAADLASDPRVGAAYRGDPLVHRWVTAAWYREFERARAALLPDASRVRGAVLLLHGADDPVARARGVARLASAMTAATVTVRLYPGARHEVLNDPAAGRVWDDLDTWLAALGQGV